MGVITYGASLQNEVKGWPPLVAIGAGFDLVTQNQWWDTELTPTTEATAVPSSGEAGLDAKFLEVIKCVTNAVNEGFKQVYTYADEPRIKLGTHLSALVWMATTASGSGATILRCHLRNSDATLTEGTVVASDGDWSLYAVEDHTCAGTSVELVCTSDAAGTFYAGGPITVMIGADAIALPPRGLVFRDKLTSSVVSGVDPGGSFTDADFTTATSNLGAILQVSAHYQNQTTAGIDLNLRRNGSALAASLAGAISRSEAAGTIFYTGSKIIVCDDAQIIEYVGGAAGDTEAVYLHCHGFWEWA